MKYFALHAFVNKLVFACEILNQHPEALVPDVLTCQSSFDKRKSTSSCLFMFFINSRASSFINIFSSSFFDTDQKCPIGSPLLPLRPPVAFVFLLCFFADGKIGNKSLIIHVCVSPQCQQIEFHLIITNQLFDMWPMFNQAGFLVITCLNALLTRHINIGLGFQGSAIKKNSFEN